MSEDPIQVAISKAMKWTEQSSFPFVFTELAVGGIGLSLFGMLFSSGKEFFAFLVTMPIWMWIMFLFASWFIGFITEGIASFFIKYVVLKSDASFKDITNFDIEALSRADVAFYRMSTTCMVFILSVFVSSAFLLKLAASAIVSLNGRYIID